MKRRLMLVAIWLLCQLAHVVAAIWMLIAALAGRDRAWRIAIGYDQLANVAMGGSEDETISSRASRARKAGQRWGCVLCSFLNWVQPNHCEESEGV